MGAIDFLTNVVKVHVVMYTSLIQVFGFSSYNSFQVVFSFIIRQWFPDIYKDDEVNINVLFFDILFFRYSYSDWFVSSVN